MSIFNTLADFGRANAQSRAEQKKTKAAERARADSMELLRSQQRDPYLAAGSIPTYQRSQSPVADAFLQSLLTGENAGAVQGTRAGAAGQQRAAQRGFDASTGGMDALRERQRNTMLREQYGGAPWRLNDRAPLSSRIEQSKQEEARLLIPHWRRGPKSGG